MDYKPPNALGFYNTALRRIGMSHQASVLFNREYSTA